METFFPESVELRRRATQNSVPHSPAKHVHPKAARTQESLTSEELKSDLGARSD